MLLFMSEEIQKADFTFSKNNNNNNNNNNNKRLISIYYFIYKLI